MRSLDMIKIMSPFRNLHCRILSYCILVFFLFTLLSKTKDTINFSRLKNYANNDDVLNIFDKYGVSASLKGLPRDHLEAINYYYAVFQGLAKEGYLSPASKSLCIQSTKLDQEVIALKRVGISDVVVSGQDLDQFGNNTFDFEFFGQRTCVDVWSVDRPLDTASAVCRILKHGGYLVVHVSVQDEYSFSSFINLFSCCRLVKFRDIESLNSSYPIREVILRKSFEDSISNDFAETCSNDTIPEYKWDLIRDLDPLEEKEPRGDWTEGEKYSESIKLFKYLPTMVDLSYKRRYAYIDLGARTYDSTIGNWFKKLYPKQNKRFEIYAIEADKSFHGEYRNRKDVILLPYAAWIRNETLVFGTRNRRREYTGKIQAVKSEVTQDYEGEQNVVQAFDFGDWLIRSFSKQDFIVLKMDVEGTEMDLIPRLVESGAICLIDELFVECHYDRWVKGKRTKRYNTTYEQCFNLFSKLRQGGSLAHQWW